MNYADIRPIDVANGPGIRVSVFVSGCTHACPECFNPEAWDFEYGTPFTQESVDTVLKALEKPYIKGLSLLGGEPCHPRNQGAVLDLVHKRTRFADRLSTFPPSNLSCHAEGEILSSDKHFDKHQKSDEPYEGETTVLHYLEVLRDKVGFDKLKEKVVNPLTGKKICLLYTSRCV